MSKPPTKAIRTIALTPKGKKAIAHMPKLTWDDVLQRTHELGQKDKTPR